MTPFENQELLEADPVRGYACWYGSTPMDCQDVIDTVRDKADSELSNAVKMAFTCLQREAKRARQDAIYYQHDVCLEQEKYLDFIFCELSEGLDGKLRKVCNISRRSDCDAALVCELDAARDYLRKITEELAEKIEEYQNTIAELNKED